MVHLILNVIFFKFIYILEKIEIIVADSAKFAH